LPTILTGFNMNDLIEVLNLPSLLTFIMILVFTSIFANYPVLEFIGVVFSFICGFGFFIWIIDLLIRSKK